MGGRCFCNCCHNFLSLKYPRGRGLVLIWYLNSSAVKAALKIQFLTLSLEFVSPETKSNITHVLISGGWVGWVNWLRCLKSKRMFENTQFIFWRLPLKGIYIQNICCGDFSFLRTSDSGVSRCLRSFYGWLRITTP